MRVNEIDIQSLGERADGRTNRPASEVGNAGQAAESGHVLHVYPLRGLSPGRKPIADQGNRVSAFDEASRPAVDVDRAAVGHTEQPKALPGHGR